VLNATIVVARLMPRCFAKVLPPIADLNDAMGDC